MTGTINGFRIPSGSTVIGSSLDTDANYCMAGYVDDVRMVKGVGILPLELPTVPFPTTGARDTTYPVTKAFDTDMVLSGPAPFNAWRSATGCPMTQRISYRIKQGTVTVRQLRVVNFHDNGTMTGHGVRNVRIYVQTFMSVMPQYNDENGTLIYDGEIPQNTGANGGKDKIALPLFRRDVRGEYINMDCVDTWDPAALWMGLRRVQIGF